MSELDPLLQTERERRIDDMLTHYRDALEMGQPRGETVRVKGGGETCPELPAIWKRSGYPTLERLLAAMKLGAGDCPSSWYGHVRGWYFDARVVRVDAYLWVTGTDGKTKLDGAGNPVPRRTSQGVPIRRVQNGVEQFELRVTRAATVDESQVAAAVRWLAENWPGKVRGPERFQEIVRRLEIERENMALGVAA